MSFIDKHNANKKVSIYTSIISFILGWVVVFYLIVIKGLTPAQDWAVALLIIVLGLSSVSMGSDLRGFLKILRNNNSNDDKKIMKRSKNDYIDNVF
ncbi:endonuclease [uncultured Brachyspira sp.]|uniref:endonuclease n=1 Tax=uncultured Brachyspira sp. TaxID=221953 RepID=UPI002613BACD|nr:endonuclease [uncultured Brachyspira sp.]